MGILGMPSGDPLLQAMLWYYGRGTNKWIDLYAHNVVGRVIWQYAQRGKRKKEKIKPI